MEELLITKEKARRLILTHQELLPPRQLKDRDILAFVRKVGCIQYDPLSRIARNAELVLQSRIQNYRESDLYNLLYQKRDLWDGWDKMMSLWDVNDWPCFARARQDFQEHYDKREDMVEARSEIKEYLSRFESLSSHDIESNKQVHWSWAPTTVIRAALESMYHTGELSIHHKEGTRKFYAFTKDLLPKKIREQSDPNKTLMEYHDWFTLRRTASQGLYWNRGGSGAWLGTNMKKGERTASIKRLLNRKKLIPLTIENVKFPFFIRKEEFPLLKTIIEEEDLPRGGAAFIAPLDNLIWDRQLIEELFGFNYRWEVYTPEKQRQYGYYVLPVLHKNRFIARFEPIMDRKSSILKIENWWWEENESLTDEILGDLKIALTAFKEFLGAQRITVSRKHKMREFSWMKTV